MRSAVRAAQRRDAQRRPLAKRYKAFTRNLLRDFAYRQFSGELSMGFYFSPCILTQAVI